MFVWALVVICRTSSQVCTTFYVPKASRTSRYRSTSLKGLIYTWCLYIGQPEMLRYYNIGAVVVELFAATGTVYLCTCTGIERNLCKTISFEQRIHVFLLLYHVLAIHRQTHWYSFIKACRRGGGETAAQRYRNSRFLVKSSKSGVVFYFERVWLWYNCRKCRSKYSKESMFKCG